MTHIKELLKAVMPSDEIKLVFKNKLGNATLTDQDKKHIRIIAIIELAHDRDLMNYILNHSFKESFKLDEKKQEVIYTIKFIKERSKNYRGDC